MSGQYNVISLSGGKDSTALLLMLIDRGIAIDDAVFFDTGWEFPEMYAHLERLERDTGIEITRLRYKQSFDYLMFDHELTRGKRKGERGYGWAKPNARWCTYYKCKTIDDFINGHQHADCVNHFIGIAADEQRPLQQNKIYPLIEWGITEAQALEYCLARGYNWDGLYSHFHRVSCWCCPLKSLNELRALRRYHPDLWCRLLTMDEKACNDFRIDYTAFQLEERFAKEDAQLTLEVFQ